MPPDAKPVDHVPAAGRRDSRRVLILGGGFAGAYCAQELERRARGLPVDIVLFDRHNYFVFHPLLMEAGTGSLEPRHAVVSIRRFLSTTRFIMAEVLDVDQERREVVYQVAGEEHVSRMGYDHLVVAPGSVTLLPPVPGLSRYGFQLKSLADAVGLRDRAIQMLEISDALTDSAARRARLHFVVVGGNFTGVEAAGELEVLLSSARRLYRTIRRDEIKVTLIDRADKLLSSIAENDLSEYARLHLLKRGIDVRLNVSVREVREDHVILTDGAVLPACTVLWCAGIAPSPLIARLKLPIDERGYVLCERDLRVAGCSDVWAIGDCAVNIDAEGKPYPATAQHAVRQGVALARNLARVLQGQPARPCDIRHQGSLVALGCRTGVAKVFGVKLSGFPAWFLWRTVYLMKMPGWTRRVRIALDWTLALLFTRDYVQLGLHRGGWHEESEKPGHDSAHARLVSD
ncbi:NAD(P)/FAD-dependent oxidoreductase [bacterium]|nr:NAD(P)/FAD-dependent oxidoreductase [bacterium]